MMIVVDNNQYRPGPQCLAAMRRADATIYDLLAGLAIELRAAGRWIIGAQHAGHEALARHRSLTVTTRALTADELDGKSMLANVCRDAIEVHLAAAEQLRLERPQEEPLKAMTVYWEDIADALDAHEAAGQPVDASSRADFLSAVDRFQEAVCGRWESQAAGRAAAAEAIGPIVAALERLAG